MKELFYITSYLEEVNFDFFKSYFLTIFPLASKEIQLIALDLLSIKLSKNLSVNFSIKSLISDIIVRMDSNNSPFFIDNYFLIILRLIKDYKIIFIEKLNEFLNSHIKYLNKNFQEFFLLHYNYLTINFSNSLNIYLNDILKIYQNPLINYDNNIDSCKSLSLLTKYFPLIFQEFTFSIFLQ